MMQTGFYEIGKTSQAFLSEKQKAEEYQSMLRDNLLPYTTDC